MGSEGGWANRTVCRDRTCCRTRQCAHRPHVKPSAAVRSAALRCTAHLGPQRVHQRRLDEAAPRTRLLLRHARQRALQLCGGVPLGQLQLLLLRHSLNVGVLLCCFCCRLRIPLRGRLLRHPLLRHAKRDGARHHQSMPVCRLAAGAGTGAAAPRRPCSAHADRLGPPAPLAQVRTRRPYALTRCAERPTHQHGL